MIISVEGSSIFNIDYAAGIFCGVVNPHDEIHLLLNDRPIISEIKNHRRFISRLSLPTFKWIYSTGEESKSNDNVWRLEYLPIEEFTDQNTDLKLGEILKTILHYLNAGGYLVDNGEISIRVNHLIGLAQGIKQSKKIKWTTKFYSEIIRTIFNETLQVNLAIDFLGGFKKLNTTHYNKAWILTGQLFQELKSRERGEYKFIKGGYIEIIESKKKPIKADIVALIDKEKLLLKDSKTQKAFTFKLNAFNTLTKRSKLAKYTFGCRGPIQMLILRRFGVLAHLPWYGKAEIENSSQPSCREYISPISVSDSLRVSTVFGGQGYRLSPAGYSLIDYESDEVLGLVRGLTGDLRITFDTLYDWRHLSNNFPPTKEKLAEHQREVIPYISYRTKETRSEYRSGRLLKTNLLFTSFNKINFAELGVYIIELASFLEHVRNILSIDNQISFTQKELDLLIEKKWLNQDGLLNIDSVVSNLESALTETLIRLKNLGFPEHKFNTALAKIKAQLTIVTKLDKIPVTQKDAQLFSQYSDIGGLNSSTQRVLEYYYSFVSFIVSTILKANIFNCYLLFGPEKYRRIIQEILDKRTDRKFLQFNPIYFTKVKP